MRLFVAIDLPDDVKTKLGELQTPIPTAKWVEERSMHLTLRFIGEVPDDMVEAIIAALSTINAESFALTLRSVGCFPPNPRKPPRVLWVGMNNQPLLEQLQGKVERQIRALGIEPDHKPFSPHFTLARLKATKPLHEATTFLNKNQDFQVKPFPVESFTLYSSVLSSTGSIYNVEASYPLQIKE